MIGRELDHDPGGCAWAYAYHGAKFRAESRGVDIVAAMKRLSPAAQKTLAEPVARPRHFSDVDRDINLRIARQGLTAGVFGDPPPGRSALDQRRQS